MDHNEPNATFHVGDLVVARASEQGLIAGEYYAITDFAFHAMPFGVGLAYVLQPAAGRNPLTIRSLDQLVEHIDE